MWHGREGMQLDDISSSERSASHGVSAYWEDQLHRNCLCGAHQLIILIVITLRSTNDRTFCLAGMFMIRTSVHYV